MTAGREDVAQEHVKFVLLQHEQSTLTYACALPKSAFRLLLLFSHLHETAVEQ